MKDYEAGSSATFEGADGVFQSVKVDTDEPLVVSDLVLQVVSSIAFEVSAGEDITDLDFEWENDGADEASIERANTIVQAIYTKHFETAGLRKNHDVRHIAKELVIDILAGKQSWKPYADIFRLCAERNDREFFERLVRGTQRKRKSVFDKVEWVSLLNWHGWTSSHGASYPALKYWTADAALALLGTIMDLGDASLNIRDAKGLYTKWKRLGLSQEKPSRVTGMFPVRNQPGKYKIVTIG